MRLSKDHLADTWSLRVAPDATVAFESRCTWSLASGARVTYGWEPVDGTSCVVSGPWRSARDLRLVPLLPDEFVDAAVTLRWRDAGRERARDESFSPGDARPRTVRLRSTELAFPKLTAEVMVTLGDRMPFLGEETEVRDPVLVVTDRAQRVRRIQTTLLAPARLADAGVAAVRVQLIDANDEATVIDQVLFTESRRGPLGLLATIGADGKLAYRYRVIRYTPQGVAATSAAVTSSAPEILVAAKAP
ncbi:MAG: hypothetical protein U0326_21345 [Polyangiales bacterium]